MKRALIIWFCVCIVAVSADAQPRLVPDSLFAPSINRVKRFLVLLPEGYNKAQRYPVLFLLHGLWGNYADWTTLARIEDHSAAYQILIVMPDGEGSWYANASGNVSERFEDYLAGDLQAYILAHYQVDTAHIGIAGLSMGGFGSIVQAFHHPEKYFFAGSLSGAFTIPRYINARDRSISDPKQMSNLRRIFGDSTSATRRMYDLLDLSMKAEPDSLPYLYLAVGAQDPLPGLLASNRELSAHLSDRGVPYEYHETPGGHSWGYWDREIVPLLHRFVEVIRDGYRPVTRPLREVIREGGIAEGKKLFSELRNNPRYFVTQDDLVGLGWSLLQGGKISGGLDVFMLNTQAFPKSWKAFEQLGAASLATADTLRATASYLRALELNPGNADLKRVLDSLKHH